MNPIGQLRRRNTSNLGEIGRWRGRGEEGFGLRRPARRRGGGRVGKGEVAAAGVLALGFGVGETYTTGEEERARCPISPLVQRDRGARPLDGLSGVLGQWLELTRPCFCQLFASQQLKFKNQIRICRSFRTD